MLSEQQTAIRDMARRFAQEEVAPHAAGWAAAHTVPDHIVRRLGELGFLGMFVPESHGGSDADVLTFLLAMEEVAAADGGLSTLMHVHAIGVARVVARRGTPAQRDRWLAAMASGAAIGAFCLTEPDAGSDTAAIRTRAMRVEGGWRLSGTKQFITNGARAGVALVIAVTDPAAGKRGVSAFLIPTDSPGFTVARVEDKLGQASSDTAQIVLDDVFAPDDTLFGEEGRALPMALELLAEGRISVAAQAVGMARAAFERALAFAHERRAFGSTIAEHQAVAFRLADMATQIEVARTFAHAVAGRLDRGEPCLKEASMAKLHAGIMAERVCSAAIETLGGYGYLRDYEVERIYRDVRVCQIYEGTNDIQRMIIARQLAAG